MIITSDIDKAKEKRLRVTYYILKKIHNVFDKKKVPILLSVLD